jgi:4-hydroxysphinganine ceramide fatty acyl 2-hydroxylase
MNTTTTTQGILFKNPVIERLTKSNPWITVVFYTSLIALFFSLSFWFTSITLLQTLGFYLGGLFTWTLMEYILHRYVFHIDEYFPVLKRLPYMLHGVHHEHPRDHERLFMPPLPGAIIAFVLFLLWYLFLRQYAFAFMAGISNGYLFYSFIHYTVHIKPAVFHKLWTHHAKHHYIYSDKAFGVSSPLWDIVFGTMPPKKTK